MFFNIVYENLSELIYIFLYYYSYLVTSIKRINIDGY